MKFAISFSGETARLDYHGDLNEGVILNAHCSLSADARFYGCRNLIIDLSRSSLKNVSIPKLDLAIATDLGASRTVRALNVAFIADDPINCAKILEFIERSKLSPWDKKLYPSLEAATNSLEISVDVSI
jgi:hypothetical protein